MKNTILVLFTIVALASCGNETETTKPDTTTVCLDSTTCHVDSTKVDTVKIVK